MKSIYSLARITAILIILTLLFLPGGQVLGESIGPNNPGTAVNNTDVGTVPWIDPGNITSLGAPYASVSFSNQINQISNYLMATNYGFDIPAEATITGITVVINRYANNTPSLIADQAIYLVVNDSYTGDNKADTINSWPSSLGSAVYGSSLDLWGATWTPDQINDSSFGVALSISKDSNGNRSAMVDSVQISVNYAFDSNTTVDCGNGVPSTTYGTSITCVATVARVSGTSSPSGTISWTTDGSGTFTTSPCTLSGVGGTSSCQVSYTPSAVGNGSHLVTAVYNGDTNFVSSQASQTVIVNQRPVTVTADSQSKAYGDADPILTYQVTSGSLVVSDDLTGGLTREAGEAVGMYAIQQGTLALSSDYDLTFVGADLTITQRPVTVTADAQTKAYGDADPALTYQVTSGSLVFGDDFTGGLTRDSGEDVGSYAIQQGTLALSSDYDLTFVGADLTITQRPVTVAADNQTKVFGEADLALTYQLISGSLLTGDSIMGELTRDPGEDVGTYAIRQGSLALAAYYDLTYVGADLNIIKATPGLSVSNSPVTYNGLPQSAIVIGSVDGLATNILYDGSATIPTDTGTYAVTADFTPSDTNNYNSLVGASAGDFVILPASPELTLTAIPTPATFGIAGTVINFNYLLTNSGVLMLTGPFTVVGDITTVSCPATASLTPGESITCSAWYTIAPNDVIAGFVTNTATGYGTNNENSVASNAVQTTVSAYKLSLPVISN
jgi:hypothetical protein